ncbi:MAG: hypothetical protein ACJA1N_001645 [Saprospiraceae bacterium]
MTILFIYPEKLGDKLCYSLNLDAKVRENNGMIIPVFEDFKN